MMMTIGEERLKKLRGKLSSHLTTKQLIIEMLRDGDRMSCQEMTKVIIETKGLIGNVANYKSASVSTICTSLVKDGILKYDGQTTRGGHVYMANLDNMTQQEAILEVLREGGNFNVCTLRESTEQLLGRKTEFFAAELRTLIEKGMVQLIEQDPGSENYFLRGTNTF